MCKLWRLNKKKQTNNVQDMGPDKVGQKKHVQDTSPKLSTRQDRQGALTYDKDKNLRSMKIPKISEVP